MEAARHPEVEEGPGPAVQLEPEMLAVPPHRRHAPASQRAGEARRAHALEDDGVGRAVHGGDAAAAGHALDERAGRLHLGQLGHYALALPGAEKGPAARRRPRTGREAYSLYGDRPVEGGNEADGPLSAPGTTA